MLTHLSCAIMVGVFSSAEGASPRFPGTTGQIVFLDDFNDDFLDLNTWSVYEGPGAAVSEGSGVLTLSVSGQGSATAKTVHAFVGDFDAWVGFDLLQFPAVDICHASFRILSTEPGNMVALKRSRGATWNHYEWFQYVDGSYQSIAVFSTDDTSGKFRIKRIGSQFTAYVWSGGWQPIGGTVHFSGMMRLKLDTFSTVSGPAAVAAFDNCQVVADDMTGNLQGMVFDAATGEPIANADVSLSGQQGLQTGEDGMYAFVLLPSGPATLSVTKEGFQPVWQEITIESGRNNSLDVGMSLDAPIGTPVIVDVRSPLIAPERMKTYALDGVPASQMFAATVDWQGLPPGEVHFVTPQGTSQADGSGAGWTVTLDLGADLGAGGTLVVKAISANGVESAPYLVNCKAVPGPGGMSPDALAAVLTGSVLKYTTSLASGETMCLLAGVPEGVIPGGIPVFGGEALRLGTAWVVDVEVNGDGSAAGTFTFLEGLPACETQLGGMASRPSVSGYVTWRYQEHLDGWTADGQVALSDAILTEGPPQPVATMLGAGPLSLPVYLRGRIEAVLLDNLELTEWVGVGEPAWSGVLDLDPFPAVESVLGVQVADMVFAEAYVGGGARMSVQFPQQPTLSELRVFLAGDARTTQLLFEVEDAQLEYAWDVQARGYWSSAADKSPGLHLLTRSRPRHGGRNAMAPSSKSRRGTSRDIAGSSRGTSRDVAPGASPIQLNVFRQSTPTLSEVGGELCVAWVFDDPTRLPVNRAELVFSRYDGVTQTWSSPAAVADDGSADFHPQLAPLPNGDALIAWENVDGPILDQVVRRTSCFEQCQNAPDPDQCQLECTLDVMKGRMEISAAAYDGATGIWGEQVFLTDNTWLDRSPRIAAAQDGTAMLTWIGNPSNDVIGTTQAPNSIHYATFDGTQWAAPGLVASDVPSIVKSAMAYDGNRSVILFAGDTDGDLQTLEDRELFQVSYANGAWGPIAQLTSDPPGAGIEDANPKVTYDSNGDKLVVWYRGGDLYIANDAVTGSAQLVVDLPGASSGAADFRLVSGLDGRRAVLWQDSSTDTVDLWYALFMPGGTSWTLPRRLTRDNAMEHAVAPIFDAGGALLLAYCKVSISYEMRTIDVNGTPVLVDNIPVPGQTDLYLLRHPIDGDLSLRPQALAIEPANPDVGTEATIVAIVENVGDLTAAMVEVAFYDGDPATGGSLIGTASIPGPLSGGGTAEASVVWTVPVSSEPHDLFVVVDPNLQQVDADRSNNLAVLADVMKPDLTIDSILTEKAGPQARILTIRVANVGVLPADGVEVMLYQNATTGPVLATLSVNQPIAPGAHHDVTWGWQTPPTGEASVDVFAVADPSDTIDEHDETDNTRWAIVTLFVLPGDLDSDGTVSMNDVQPFIAALLGFQLDPYTIAAADMNGDGSIDGGDIQPFVEALQGP